MSGTSENLLAQSVHQTGGLVHLTALLVTFRMLAPVLILWKYFVRVSDNGETQ